MGQRQVGEPSGDITGVDLGCPNCPAPEASTLIVWDNISGGNLLAVIGSQIPYRLSMIERNEDGYASSATLYRQVPQCGATGHCTFEAQLDCIATKVRTHIGRTGCKYSEVRTSERHRQGNS